MGKVDDAISITRVANLLSLSNDENPKLAEAGLPLVFVEQKNPCFCGIFARERWIRY